MLTAPNADSIIGVVREESVEAAESVAEAYARNGIRILEVTLTTPDAFDLISRFAQTYAALNVVIAAGTVRNDNDAAQARRAGAQIIVSPHTDLRVIETGSDASSTDGTQLFGALMAASLGEDVLCRGGHVA